MDIASVLGVILAFTAIIASILTGGDLLVFVDIPSLLVVGGGLIATVLIKWPMEMVKNLVGYLRKVFFFTPSDPKTTIEEIIKLAETARRESVFALEKIPIDDAFLKKAVTLAADNRPPEVISAILQLEIDAMVDRHKIGISMMEEIAADGPAFGMIGTLIGLVIMLQNLSDPSAIGPAMAVALLTTFYGSIIANVIGNPFKSKLAIRSKMEETKLNIIVAGTLGIVAGENPRLIKEKLNSFLPPSQRIQDGDGGGGGE